MNNLNKKFIVKEDLLRSLDLLYLNDISRFNFIKALTESVINRKHISISMSRNENAYNISVIIGEHIYEEAFYSIERANNFIDIISSLNKNT